MADTYRFQAGSFGGADFIVRSSEGAFDAWIPLSLDNGDYLAFLAWIAAGNEPPEGWTGPQNPVPA